MSLNVGNCPRCGKIFVKGFNEVCPACTKENELQYEKCLKYLRENKGTNIHELSEATEVSMRQITKFIREGRISIVNAPNMSYACEVCGMPIRDNTICESCRAKLSKELRNGVEDEKRKEQNQQDARFGFKIQERLNERN